MPMELVSKQLALSGRLKPEVRLGLAISEFAQVLDNERRKEFRTMQNTQDAQICGRDIIKMTEEINQEGARRHRSWRPHGTKVGGFLARIQTFATIGDVFVGGSQNLIASGVWSAIRLSLTIATNYLGYFEKLSTLFMRLSTSWTLHKDFAQLFPASEVLQVYLYEYLISLMKLCSKAVAFCQKTTRAQFLSSLASSFDSEFGPLQRELDQWGSLIQQQSQLLATKMAYDAQKGRYQDFKQRLLRNLSPDQNDFETRWRRQRKKGTCKWIFDTPAFKDWKSMQSSATLSVQGKLGSGKTVTMANIVARMNIDQSCAYVFCATQEQKSLKATNILGSIAFSMLDNLPAEATAQSKIAQNDTTVAFDPETIIDLLLSLLPEKRRYIVIADGLEDCSDADIDDVLLGLRRLMQNRLVLVCYSSRSDSKFQHVAKQYLAPEFSVSHEESNHDAEIESYIMKEVTIRNATRHLSPDLEDLVKKQLIAGAQGMYLWVSLQLDSLFPANSKVVNTDDQVLNLITNLPRDLPEAFEQALERIPDRQYEGRIMKLVMSAVTPLDINEIRVALCVVVGEPVWYPEKIAQDGSQLISLCGGNLLDLDEEDRKVRFIHHSIIQHLLQPAARESTIPYHFAIEEAESFTGTTCVTYLHLPILDSRMVVTKTLHSTDMVDNVVGTTRRSLPIVSRLIEHIKSRENKRARPSTIDIGQLVTRIQATQTQQTLEPRCFAHYATTHWVFHTRFFDEKNIDYKSWKLWWQLLHGIVATVTPPCPNFEVESYPVLLWAVEHGHGSLFRIFVQETYLRDFQVVELINALRLHKSIHGQWLGDFLSQYLHNLWAFEMPYILNDLTVLLDLEADPSTSHHITDAEPLETLARKICSGSLSRDDEKRLVREVFSHPTVQKCVQGGSLLGVLEKLLKNDKRGAADEIISFYPYLRVQADRILATPGSTSSKPVSPKVIDDARADVFGRVFGPKTALEAALENERWEEIEALSFHCHVNTPTSLGTSLLWMAIENMSDIWVCHLLRLGANPNAGPFTVQPHLQFLILQVRNRKPASMLFPLEAALWLNRTLVCVELLHYGASAHQLGPSLMRIAREANNLIMVAILREIQGAFRSNWKAVRRRIFEGNRTALATACKMLSHSARRESHGFSIPLCLHYTPGDLELELGKIIHRLVPDDDPEYVNAPYTDGRTALHYLLGAHNTATRMFGILVDALLNAGADPDFRDYRGETPLWLAIRYSTPVDVIQRLLQEGADPNTARPLHVFSILEEAMCEYQGTKQDVMRLMRLLLRAGADPRNPVTLASPDPSLLSTASSKGLESLNEDFEEHGNKWDEQGIIENAL